MYDDIETIVRTTADPVPLLASTAVLRTALSLSETLEAPGLTTRSEAEGIGAWNFSHRIGAGSENHASRPAAL